MSTYRKDLKRILKCCESLFYICTAILICHSQIVTVTRRLGISTDLTALPLLCIAERSGPLYAQIPLCPQWQTVSTALELVDLTSPDKLNLHQPSHLQIKPRTLLQATCIFYPSCLLTCILLLRTLITHIAFQVHDMRSISEQNAAYGEK